MENVSTSNPISCVIVCDWEDRARPMVLVSSREKREAAEAAASVIYETPRFSLEDFESHGMKDVLIGGIEEKRSRNQTLVFGADRDNVCYGVIGIPKMSFEDAVLFLKKLAMRLTLKVDDEHRDALSVAASEKGQETMIELCQQQGQQLKIEGNDRKPRVSRKQKILLPGLRYIMKFYYGQDHEWTGESSICKGTYQFPDGFFTDSALQVIPQKGAVVGEYSWARDTNSLLVYFPNYWGVCDCVVASPECSLDVAIQFLDNVRASLRCLTKTAARNLVGIDAMCTVSCPESPKFSFRNLKRKLMRDNKSFISLWENVSYTGGSPHSLSQQALLGPTEPLSRIDESETNTPESQQQKPHQISSRQLIRLGQMAKKRVVLPRERSRLMNRCLPRPNPPARQESNGTASQFGSDWDDHSSQWEYGSFSGSDFEWVDIRPMEDGPGLFPYYVSSGISISAYSHSTGTRTSTVRTKSCESISWSRNK